jgi:hypothetical protein
VNGDANLADAVVRDNATVTLYRDNGDNIPNVADVLVAGTATFRGGPSAYGDNISALRSAAAGSR